MFISACSKRKLCEFSAQCSNLLLLFSVKKWKYVSTMYYLIWKRSPCCTLYVHLVLTFRPSGHHDCRERDTNLSLQIVHIYFAYLTLPQICDKFNRSTLTVNLPFEIHERFRFFYLFVPGSNFKIGETFHSHCIDKKSATQ